MKYGLLHTSQDFYTMFWRDRT